MAQLRREKTLADYVVIALSPALIMTLVGSLAFFLLAVAYRGQFETRVQWVLFWFVMGAVLVARIAIEQEKEQASLLGWILAGLTGLFVYKYIEPEAQIVAWVLLAVIWWCSWKLTWDCTLIDDGADSSGEGLIEAAGLVGGKDGVHPQSTGSSIADRAPRAEAQEPDDERPTGWHRLISDTSQRRRRPHAPGLWVVYFSLAALPLFGVGQLFIPAVQSDRRSHAFLLLAVYVASALGLLLTTSFLGLRRYLRQRKLQMPVAMTATWIGMGTTLAVALLLLALLIPRPQGEYTITEWIDKVDAKAREASRLAMLRDGRGEGAGRRIGEQDQKAGQPGDRPPPEQQQADQKLQQQEPQQGPDRQRAGQPGDQKQQQPGGRDGQNQPQGSQKPGPDGKQQAQANGQGKQPGQGDRKGDAAGQKGDKAAGKQNQQGRQQAQQNQQQAGANQPDAKQNDPQQKPGEPPPRGENAQAAKQAPPPPAPPTGSMLTNVLTSLAPFVKWILYGLLAAIAIYQVFRHWARFVEMLLNLWNELLSLFGFGSRPESAGGSAAADHAPEPPPPFASFNDPFLDGTARRMALAQLVRYTFEALEAWSREQGLPRSSEQTPFEFAAELGRQIPKASKDISETAQIYVQVAYARGNPSRDSLDVLERMWRRMNVMANA
jgi:hypothetical protein